MMQYLLQALQNAVAYQQQVNVLTLAIAAKLADGGIDPAAAGLQAALGLLEKQAPERQLADLARLLRDLDGAA